MPSRSWVLRAPGTRVPQRLPQKCPPSPSRCDPRSYGGRRRRLGAHAAARGWPGRGAALGTVVRGGSPPPAAPGCPSASRGSAASEQLRAAGLGRPRPLSTLPLRPRPPLAGGPSAWPDTWQLTGAVLGPRRGGGGGRGAGACRGPRLREAEGAAAASLVRAERSARAAAPHKAGWARGRPSV